MALADFWTLIDNGSVPVDSLGEFQYVESRESGKESYSPNNSQATRVFFVAWDQRSDFLDDLLGSASLSSSFNIYRDLPDPHPEIANFYAQEASVDGIGIPTAADSGAIAWTAAKITAAYRPLPYAVLSDSATGGNEINRFVNRGYTFNADYLTLNGTVSFVTSPPIVLSQPPGKITGTMEVTYHWMKVPAKPNSSFVVPNYNNVVACYGRVNSDTFDGYPPGCALFCGVDPQMGLPLLAS